MLSLDFYLSLFPASSREKPRFLALASAVLSQAADLLSLIQTDFLSAFDMNSASGVQLDVLGALLNVPRPMPSTPDADYRILLRARAAVNHWDGTNGSLPAVLESAFPGQSARLMIIWMGLLLPSFPALSRLLSRIFSLCRPESG